MADGRRDLLRDTHHTMHERAAEAERSSSSPEDELLRDHCNSLSTALTVLEVRAHARHAQTSHRAAALTPLSLYSPAAPARSRRRPAAAAR